jgi:hypothetical protein
MSHRLISRSPDLERLRSEGYAVEIRHGHLLVHDVPYVDASKQVRRGALVSTLNLVADATTTPDTHVVYFIGDHPCTKEGVPIAQIAHGSAKTRLAEGLEIDHSFSNRPSDGYPDYHAKITRYIEIISHPARALDESVTARTYPLVRNEEDDSPFEYIDTATSRAGIGAVTRKLEGLRIAIVGLGGTGSYVLDLMAKTPVREIHLYDSDAFLQHNAFRSPGAASVADLERRLSKVAYFREQYGVLHRGIVAHQVRVDETNVGELRDFSFVFICVDSGASRRMLVERLETMGVPFADVGMGVFRAGDGDRLGGVLRVTASTPQVARHAARPGRFPFGGDDGLNEYTTNIQVSDLNALNAALAVVRWKRWAGFYLDLEREHHATYTLDGNLLTNEDAA